MMRFVFVVIVALVGYVGFQYLQTHRQLSGLQASGAPASHASPAAPESSPGVGLRAADRPATVAYPTPQWPQTVYILAITYMPAWCAARNGALGDQRCRPEAPTVWGVHGLWPQLGPGRDNGCPTAHVLTPEAEKAGTELLGNRNLAQHEWAKHGTCSGWSADDYFKATAMLAQSLKIPATMARTAKDTAGTLEQFEAAWLTANPGLDGARLAVRCRNSELEELLFCFDGSGRGVRCPPNVHDSCPREGFRMRGAGASVP